MQFVIKCVCSRMVVSLVFLVYWPFMVNFRVQITRNLRTLLWRKSMKIHFLLPLCQILSRDINSHGNSMSFLVINQRQFGPNPHQTPWLFHVINTCFIFCPCHVLQTWHWFWTCSSHGICMANDQTAVLKTWKNPCHIFYKPKLWKKSWSCWFFSWNDTKPWNDQADIALIKVSEPFIINEFVAPVRLPKWNYTRDFSKNLSAFSFFYDMFSVPGLIQLFVVHIFSDLWHCFDCCSWSKTGCSGLGSGMGKQWNRWEWESRTWRISDFSSLERGWSSICESWGLSKGMERWWAISQKCFDPHLRLPGLCRRIRQRDLLWRFG